MFQAIVEALAHWRDRLALAEIIDAYEHGVVLRWGKYHRTLGPGYHWKWPVAELVVQVITCDRTMHLPAQPLTTLDDKSVSVGAAVKYSIINPEKFVTQVWDQHDVLADVTMGAVCKVINNTTYSALVHETPVGEITPEDKVLERVRNKVTAKYGFKVHEITFIAFARSHAIHLVQPLPKDIEN
jgi:regulator of protease activity HflC (stomatin/prohibitin superfamily)